MAMKKQTTKKAPMPKPPTAAERFAAIQRERERIGNRVRTREELADYARAYADYLRAAEAEHVAYVLPMLPKAGPDIFDVHDRAEEAQHFAAFYRTLPPDQLPGLYRRQRETALAYLAPSSELVELIMHGDMLQVERKAARASLTPSQQAALTELEAIDDLLAKGEPDTPHKLEWRDARQAAAVLAHGRLNATGAHRDRGLQIARSKGGAVAAKTKAKTAAVSKQRAVARFKLLTATGERDANEAMTAMVSEGWSRSALYRHLKEERTGLGRTRNAVKRGQSEKT